MHTRKQFSTQKLSRTVIHNRKKAGMTQSQLAEKAQMHRNMISRLERQDYIPSIPQLDRLAEILHFDPTEFWCQTP